MIRVISTLLFYFILVAATNAQNFDANIEIGFNTSQIDGDLFAGYNKIGIHGGLGVQYIFSNEWKLGSGIFYNALGSQKEIQIGNTAPEEQQKIKLSYVSVPIMMIYSLSSGEERGWHFSGGLQGSYLINSSIQDRVNDAILEFFNEIDISVAIGVDYQFSSLWSIGVKASESVTLLFNNNKVSELNSNSLRNRFLTFSFKRHL